MQKRIRAHLHERISRLYFIQTELCNIINKSIFKNKYTSHTNSYCAHIQQQHKLKIKNSISRHRIWCPMNSSPKIASKNYRLSRFSLNYLARENSVSGLLKRGW